MSRRWSLVACLNGAALICIGVVPASAREPVEPDVVTKKWGWVRVEALPPGGPWSGQSGNSVPGAVNTVIRNGIGDYTVTFGDLASTGGIVHAESQNIGGGANYCSVAGWGPSGADLEARIRCFDGIGDPTDTRFMADFRFTNQRSGKQAYLRAHRPSFASPYAPTDAYSYNSTGGANSIDRTAVGKYLVRLNGVGIAGKGTVQIDTYADLHNVCRARKWYAQSGNEFVSVFCRDASGAFADTRFVLSFLHDVGLNGKNGFKAAYLWSNQKSVNSYQPPADYRYTTNGGAPTVEHWPFGMYEVRLPKMGTGGIAFVTATGEGDHRCMVRQIIFASTTQEITVDCYSAAGVSTDGTFTLAFVGRSLVP